MRKAIIHCEVVCGCCGGLIYDNYKNSNSISKLKEMIKDWRFTDEYGNTCPDCLKKIKAK